MSPKKGVTTKLMANTRKSQRDAERRTELVLVEPLAAVCTLCHGETLATQAEDETPQHSQVETATVG